MKRMNFVAYWNGDISPINEAQRVEVAEIKANFVRSLELMSFNKGERITIDPYFRHIKLGEGDVPAKENEVIFKWGPWEFSHVKTWVRHYLNLMGFEEVYHFQLRSPVGAIEFIKK